MRKRRSIEQAKLNMLKKKSDPVYWPPFVAMKNPN
jgi:hypothetical protein